jgi:tricorn protease-like protein
MNADGTHQRAITASALLAFQPNWSPDGTRVSFASRCCRLGGDVYDISPEGADLRRLTRTPYPLFSGYPAYAPSGVRIAFMSNRNHPNRCCIDLFVMSADGAHEALIPIGGISVSDIAWGRAP